MTNTTAALRAENARETATQARLIKSALRHFGEKGFDGASLRDIVADAGQNVSAVKYHFKSKDGLFDACIHAAAERLHEIEPEQIPLINDQVPFAQQQHAARLAIRAQVKAALLHALDPVHADEVRFLKRQIILGGRGANIFFDTVLEHHLQHMTQLMRIAENGLDAEAARLRALAIMLETVLLLSAHHIVELGMAWRQISDRIPEMVDAIYPLTNQEALT